jgi:PAS domain S-box-containing protein
MSLVGLVNDTEQRFKTKRSESERRFRLMANAAPVMIWMSGADGKCTFFNKTWTEFTGRSMSEELGDGWTEGVYMDDLQRCIETYVTKIDQREPFHMEYRLRRHDGAYRWIDDSGVPLYGVDGEFTGYIGSCVDVTSRKVAEGVLSTFGQRLIQAQEEERARIARELHDDINQRLAIVSVDLDALMHVLPRGSRRARLKAARAVGMVKDLARDVHDLSHRLHSSRLDLLGLVAAAAGLCNELSAPGIRVDFHSEAVPRRLLKDVRLCAFRVLQEALQNAVKHSGAQLVHVTLMGTERDIQLTVRDSGSGFDPCEATKRNGLGIASMRERLKAVHGHLAIQSTPQQGTTVCALIPLKPEEAIEPKEHNFAVDLRIRRRSMLT